MGFAIANHAYMSLSPELAHWGDTSEWGSNPGEHEYRPAEPVDYLLIPALIAKLAPGRGARSCLSCLGSDQ